MSEPATNNWMVRARRWIGVGEAAILPTDTRQVRPLGIQMAIMCALGCLAALAAIAGFRAASTWTTDLKSAITVMVEEPRDDTALNRATEIVRAVEGVSSAAAMSREKAKTLLRNYGSNVGPLIDELPLPRLIEVGLANTEPGTQERIEAALERGGFTATVDDHSRYAGEILRTSTALRALALTALLFLVIAALASIAFGARAALQTRADAVEIMHLVGAEDSFVADEVQARFMRLGFIAGLFGAVGAGLIGFGLTSLMALGSSDLTRGTPLVVLADIWVLVMAPFVTAIASAIAARLAARETLKELV
jgi:cell division transport system permease protein